ncbi:MAG TPA: hypothetical protein VK914_07385 [bacterium]|jgi:hypothetical protein|nr:hypothetical protein [bacterium]
MRKQSLAVAAVVAVVMITLASLLAAFPLWLPSATRNNPHDPLSPMYKGTPTPIYTATTAATDTPQGTSTDSPTATPSPTQTPSPIKFYDGSANFNLASLTTSIDSGASSTIGFSEVSGGPNGSPDYLSITMTVVSSGDWGNAVMLSAPIDASSANVLSLWIKIPHGSCPAGENIWRPMVSLRTSGGGGYPNDRSNYVTATAYTYSSGASGVTNFNATNWTQVVIPLAAFYAGAPAVNNTSGGTFTQADLAAVTGVVIGNLWGNYDNSGNMPAGGAMPATLDVGDIVFLGPTTGMPAGNVPPVQNAPTLGTTFEDFETANVKDSVWGGTTWFADYDNDACAPVTTMTYPTGTFSVNGPTNTMTNPPVDETGNTLSVCYDAHITGSQADATTSCSGNYPLVRMRAAFYAGPQLYSDEPQCSTYPFCASCATTSCPSQSVCTSGGPYQTLDVSNNNTITSLGASGAKGLSFALMTNITNNTGTGQQLYSIQILRLATACTWANYAVNIADTSLQPANQWHYFSVDFPADGSTPTASNSNAYPGDLNTDLAWRQPTNPCPGQYCWYMPAPWERNDFCQLIVRVIAGGPYDIAIDDVQFY